MKNPIVEGAKQLARLAILAAIPVLTISISNSTIDFKQVSIAMAIAALGGLEKLLHEMDKQNGTKISLPF